MNTTLKAVRRSTVMTIALAVPAMAQVQPEGTQIAQTERAELEEIVVTGTLIRGIAPVGANVVGLSREDIDFSGTIDTNMLVRSMPQSDSFLTLPTIGSASLGVLRPGASRIPVSSPNLRLFFLTPGVNSGPITLVMMDGHRLVPVGLEQSVVESGIIPPGIVDRVETILDGASAVYGSDAVGGVLNFIPYKRFDGVEVSATYGVADDYYATSADATWGTSWDTGGFALSYSFGDNSSILLRERDHQIARNFLDGERPVSLNCLDHSHVSPTTAPTRTFVTYAGETTFAERSDWCNLGYETYMPEIERHSGFAVFSQAIGSRVRLDVTGFYSERTRAENAGPEVSTVTITPANPYYRPLPGVAGTPNQTVRLNYGPVLGLDYGKSDSIVELWQVTPSLTVDLGGNWQVRSSIAYGESDTIVDQNILNAVQQSVLVGGTTIATAINPYDIAATQNLSLIDGLRARAYRKGTHEFISARAIADGPVFKLPGGEVRLAVGAEWSQTEFERLSLNNTTQTFLPKESTSTNNDAIFAELVVPLVGEGNSMPGISSLTLSASGRYDDYREFGDTFNPKYAITYEPVDWITIRGNWSKSFRAPNVIDKLGVTGTSVVCVGLQKNQCANLPIGPTQTPPGMTINPATDVYVSAISGTDARLEPEKATNWAAGLDIRPPAIDGLTLSATYFEIDLSDKIGAPGTLFQPIFQFAPELYTLNPTQQQIADFANLSRVGGEQLLQILADGGYNVRFLIDTRVRNLAQVQIEGLDFSASYSYPTSWGSINARVSGIKGLKNDVRVFENQPFTDELEYDNEDLHMSYGLGATYGNFSASAEVQRRAGYRLDPADAVLFANQTRVDAFNVLNLAFRWNVAGSSAFTQGLQLTVVANNVLDEDPPVSRDNNGGTRNGETIGRYFQLGLTKKF